MKVHLLAPDDDFRPGDELVEGRDELAQDLGLEIVFDAMAAGDRYLREVCPRAVFQPLTDVETIHYRQAALSDCIAQELVVRELYELAVEALERERKIWGFSTRLPDSLLHRSVDALEQFVDVLRRLRGVAVRQRAGFRSVAFGRLFDELVAELSDEYLRTVQEHLARLALRDGVLVSARLGVGNRSTDLVLRRRADKPGWRDMLGLAEAGSLTFQLAPRDEAGARMVGELRGRGVALAATAVAQSSDHIKSYFVQLRAELAFYIGCLNLRHRLADVDLPTTLPDARPRGGAVLHASGLYDVALALVMGSGIVGNDLDADGKSLLLVTGANRGGKSTFLRSVGLAQLMMQAGMFVGAGSFAADARDALFTHFRREEDEHLRRGKLDEELARMSWIVDNVAPGAMVLLNESFASTNEREGAQIAGGIVHALLEAGVKVCYVTHMYELGHGLLEEGRGDTLFLRAERLPDGRRTFRIIEGEPLPTSHGQDVYRRVFGAVA
jgi:hypothetical protein